MTEDLQFIHGSHGRVTRRQHGDDAQPENALGNLRRTQRGFEIITFHDHYNQACSLQQSSLAFENAIWLGIAGNRMHLTESQVMDLVERLNVWLLSGDHSFKFCGESVEDLPAQVENKKEEPAPHDEDAGTILQIYSLLTNSPLESND